MADDTKRVEVYNPRTGERSYVTRMTKDGVKRGGEYLAKIGEHETTVRIEGEHPDGGWEATNVATGRKMRIKTADRLRPSEAAKGKESRPRKTETLTVFSFGYKGWGNASERLVGLVDAVERARGYQPPLFVDVRIRRVVRAVGFRDNRFGDLLGERYKWMKGLGNETIVTHEAGQKIAHPEDAEILLDLAMECAKKGQRVIFFCSCPSICRYCHRHEVSRLLVGAAERKGKALQVFGWPGFPPQSIRMDLTEDQNRVLMKYKVYLPMSVGLDLGLFGGLPDCSHLQATFGEDIIDLLVSPVIWKQERWELPILNYFEGGRAKELEKRQREAVTRFGVRNFSTREVGPSTGWNVEGSGSNA